VACSYLRKPALWRAWLSPRQLFFFFQAEDGIRERNVTGVQTCALPISVGHPARQQPVATQQLAPRAAQALAEGDRAERHDHLVRSEERRVGKERRCGGPRRQEAKKR